MTVYKYAPAGDCSQFEPAQRSPIDGYRVDRGECLVYRKGRVTKSPSGPGIMAYVKKPYFHKREYLVMRIPAGALIRRGMDRTKRMVAASRVVTLGRMESKKRA